MIRATVESSGNSNTPLDMGSSDAALCTPDARKSRPVHNVALRLLTDAFSNPIYAKTEQYTSISACGRVTNTTNCVFQRPPTQIEKTVSEMAGPGGGVLHPSR